MFAYIHIRIFIFFALLFEKFHTLFYGFQNVKYFLRFCEVFMKINKSVVYRLLSCLILVSILFVSGCNQKSSKSGNQVHENMQQGTSPVQPDKDKDKEQEQDKDKDKDKEAERLDVVITVQGDMTCTVENPSSFKVKKSSLWKDVKEFAKAKVQLQEGREIQEWREKDDNGAILQDVTVFLQDTTVYAVTKGIEVTYKVEHWRENLEDDNYTQVQDDTEEKRGEVGQETKAVAKEYEGFIAEAIVQQKINKDKSTLVKVYYKRQRVFLVIQLQGGKTTTQLKNGEGDIDGKQVLQGKPGQTVIIDEPTRSNFWFYGWKPSLPKTFSFDVHKREYVAQWSDNIRVFIKGDERLDIKEDYIDFLPSEAGKWANVKDRVQAQVSLKSDWAGGDYALYDWKIGTYDGKKIDDDTEITQALVVYARTNYTKFKWNEITQNTPKLDRIVGYEGVKPQGKIIIPKDTYHLLKTTFKDCDGITGIDVSECENLVTLEASGTGITNIDLSKCPHLMNLDLNDTKLEKIDVLQNPNLTWLSLMNTQIKALELPECQQLGTLDLRNTGITSLETRKCRNLHGLFLNNTKIESLDVSYFPNLHTLNLSGTQIKDLNVKECKKLGQLFLQNTPIEHLDLSGCEEVLRVLFLTNSKIKQLNLSNFICLQLLLIEQTPIISVNASGCVELVAIIAENCQELQNVNLENCPKLTSIGWDDSADPNVKYLPFMGCINAEVRLPISVTEVISNSFGKDEATWCKKVIVPNEAIKALVVQSGYPEARIRLDP